MKSIFTLTKRRFIAAGLVCMLALCFSIWLAELSQLNEKPADFDLIFSPPQSFSPGASVQIALYAFKHNSSLPVKNLNLVIRLAPKSPRKFTSPIFEAIEKKPGLYLATIELPPTLHEEIWNICVFSSKKTHYPIAIFPIEITQRLTFTSVPPQSSIRAGKAYEFKLAAIDAVTMQPISRFPIHCTTTTPDGFKTSHRTCFTNIEGTADFPFRLRKSSPTGEYLFTFQNGCKSILFKVSVAPPLQPLSAFEESCQNLFTKLPKPIKAIVAISSRHKELDKNWLLQNYEVTEKMKAAIKHKNTIEASFEPTDCDMAVIEAWINNRLLYSSPCATASSSIEIHFKRALPSNLPIEIHLWQRKHRRILSDSTVIPPTSFTSAAAFTFKSLTDVCFSNGDLVLQNFFKPFSPPEITIGKEIPNYMEFNWALEEFANSLAICLYWSFAIFLFFTPILKIVPPPDRKLWQRVFHDFTVVTATLGLAFLGILKYPDLIAEGPIPLLCLSSLIVIEKCLANTYSFYFAEMFRHLVSMLQIPSAILFLHQVADTLDIPHPTPENIFILAILGILLSTFALHRLGTLNLETIYKNNMFQHANHFMQNSFDLLLSYGWKSAISVTVILSLLLIAFFKSYLIVNPLENKLLKSEIQLNIKRTNLEELKRSITFSSIKKASLQNNIGPLLSAFEKFERLRTSRFKFLLLTEKRDWNGKKIQKLKVFTEVRTFLDRLIDCLKISDSIYSIALELGVRAVRFKFLDRASKTSEKMEMESGLIIFGHILALNLQGHKAFSDIARNFLLNTLNLVSKCVYVDNAFKQTILNIPCGKKDEFDNASFSLPFIFQSGDLPTSPASFLESLFPALKGGGALILKSKSGKRLVFPISQDGLNLTCGSSFREDFEIASLEPGRDIPILLEMFLEP